MRRPHRTNATACGSIVFAPAIGSKRLHILHQLHGHRQCLRLIQQRESEKGDRYDRVVWSRLEETWLLPHPPLSSLDRARIIVGSTTATHCFHALPLTGTSVGTRRCWTAA